MNPGSILLEPDYIYIYITCLFTLFLVVLDEVFSICSELGLLSGCGARLLIGVTSFAQECRFQGVQVSLVAAHRLQLLCSMRHLPEPRIEPMYPASAGSFLFTLPPDAFNFDTNLSPLSSVYLGVFKITIIVPYNKDVVRIQTNKQTHT